MLFLVSECGTTLCWRSWETSWLCGSGDSLFSHGLYVGVHPGFRNQQVQVNYSSGLETGIRPAVAGG